MCNKSQPKLAPVLIRQLKNFKMHAINFTINLELLPFEIFVFYNEKDENIIAILSNLGIDKFEIEHLINLPNEVKGKTMITQNNQTVIRLKSLTEDVLPGVIAHEALHAVSMIMEQMGVKFNPIFSEEIYTYSLEYVVNKIHVNLKGRFK